MWHRWFGHLWGFYNKQTLLCVAVEGGSEERLCVWVISGFSVMAGEGCQQGKVPEVIRGWYLHIIIYYHVLSYIIIYYRVLSHIIMYSLQRGRCCLRGWVCSHELWCVQAARAASSLVFLYGSLLSGANAVCPAGPAAHKLLERPD